MAENKAAVIEAKERNENNKEPRIIAFLCNWCSYAGADLAGTSRLQYPTGVRIVRVMCSGRINPLIIIKSLLEGADGVLVSGCHPGDCHYQEGNMFTRRRMELLTKLLPFYGIDPRRFRASWVSASEGGKFAEVVTRMTEELRQLKLEAKDRERERERAGKTGAQPGKEKDAGEAEPREETLDAECREDPIYEEVTQKMREVASELVAREDVKYVIGHEPSPLEGARPLFVHNGEEAQRLIFSPFCHHNLVSYLPKADKLPLPRGAKPDDRKVGVFVKSCEIAGMNQLLSERGVKREDVIVIGVECHGIVGKDDCPDCRPHAHEFEYDHVMGDPGKSGLTGLSGPAGESVVVCNDKDSDTGTEGDSTKLDMSPAALAERFDKWQNEFSKCIRCYACRNVCPLCYCEDCFVDRLDPQWVERGTDVKTNAEYLIMRAYHLAGRCIECGACQEACPVDIPHMEVNRYMGRIMKELFGDEAEAGRKKEGKSVLCDHNKDDREDDIW